MGRMPGPGLFGERPLWEVGFDGMPSRNGASSGCHYQVRHNRKDAIRGNLEPFIPLLPLPSLFSFHGRDWDGRNGSHERIELSGSSPPSPRYPTAARSIRLPTPGQSPATARSPTPARAPRALPRPPGQASPARPARHGRLQLSLARQQRLHAGHGPHHGNDAHKDEQVHNAAKPKDFKQ